MTDPKNLGLCLFGEYIARLVDQGKSENVDTISEKAWNKELVKYLIEKYKIDISNTTSYSSVDLLKRISRLEEELLRK